jgi:hypothetical protein
METTNRSRVVDIDAHARCLTYLEDDQIIRAQRQARRIKYAAIRAIAQDQIRFVLKIKTYLANGNQDQARRLTRSLIGGLKLKYQTALGIHPIPGTQPPSSSQPPEEKPAVGGGDSGPQPALASFPPDIRDTLKQLMQIIGRARAGDRHPAFSPAVLLHLGWIARRAWQRWSGDKTLSPFRADALEIRLTGACLRQRIEEGGGWLSSEDLSREMGLSPARVAVGVRNLRQFLLRGSGWRMVGGAKIGFALEPEDLDILAGYLSEDDRFEGEAIENGGRRGRLGPDNSGRLAGRLTPW